MVSRSTYLRSISPGADQLITVPGAFDRLYRFGKPMRGNSGDPRVTGSIAYELVLVSRGVTQYMYTSNPHLWDIVGGVAGGHGGRSSPDGRPAQLGPDGAVPINRVAQVERPCERVARGSGNPPRPQDVGQDP